jgi:penicillin-binding protein 1C
MSLEELVSLYSAFANQGRLRRLVFFDEDAHEPNDGIQLFKPETCFIVADMLSKLERPDLPQSWEFTPNRGRIAFKTGTSFGLRDAWSIGFNPRYTIGVWLGNVNAKSSSALVGIKAAAPLLVSIFNDLTRYGDTWFRRPDGVDQREVCAISGEPLGPFCKSKAMDYFIPGPVRFTKGSMSEKKTAFRSAGCAWMVP